MLQQHLMMAGPVVYPLLACSLLTLALIIERLLVLLVYPPLAIAKRQKQFEKKQLGKVPVRGLLAGLQLLDEHHLAPKYFRDELLSQWLDGQRQKLLAHTRWLMLLGSLAPLLGLLGTVLGIITMFQDVAHQPGPVTAAMLAEGMWEAMVTTALGLTIAIPALAASHGFSIWGDYRIELMQRVLNDCSLLVEREELGLTQYRGGQDENGRQQVIKPVFIPALAEEQSA